MLKTVKSVVKATFHLCGLDIRRIPRFGPYEWLKDMNIKTILDIGANTGQFALQFHRLFPDAKLYSFEPLEDCYNELKKRMRKVDNFEAFNMALADINGELEFHRNEHSPSSSVLPMADLHKQNYPYTGKDAVIKVQSVRLDDVAKDLKIKDNLLIKIDVQGFEDKVIVGGENTIKQAKILIIETSFQPLYIGQPLFEDMYDLLKQDFRYIGSLGESRVNRSDGTPLFEDSIFVNKSSESYRES